MLRVIHNRSIVKYILATLGIGFAIYFAWSFFPFGEWVGKHFMQDAPGGTQVLGWISAAVMFGCVLIVVFWKEYIKENAHAYSNATNDNSFKNAFQMFTWFVLGLEFFSVLFRAIMIDFGPVSIVILGVGVLGMGVTYIVGKLLHSEVNVPPSVAAARMRTSFQRSAFEEGEKMGRDKKRFNIFQRMQIGTGDHGPIHAAFKEDYSAQAREQAVKEDQRKEAEKERKANEDFYHNMTSPPEQPTTSPNGKQPNFK